MMVWSLVTLGNMGIKDRGSYFALRALLGIFEGGFIADTVLYLSYYYSEYHAAYTTVCPS